jgi:hypothetical protein
MLLFLNSVNILVVCNDLNDAWTCRREEIEAG